MELTVTQFRAITKAKTLLAKLESSMGQNDKAVWNEICSDWADLALHDPDIYTGPEDINPNWQKV